MLVIVLKYYNTTNTTNLLSDNVKVVDDEENISQIYRKYFYNNLARSIASTNDTMKVELS